MKNIYNKVMNDAMIEIITLAVWPMTENTFGIAVFTVSVKLRL